MAVTGVAGKPPGLTALLEENFNLLNQKGIGADFNKAMSDVKANLSGASPQQAAVVNSFITLGKTEFFAINHAMHMQYDLAKQATAAGALPSAFKSLMA